MKKKLLIIALLLAVLGACKKERQLPESIAVNTIPDSATLSVSDARLWTENRQKSTKLNTSAQNRAFDIAKATINWEQVKSGQSNRSSKQKPGNYLYAPVEGTATFQHTKQGFRRLLFSRTDNGDIKAYLMEVIPDALAYQRAGRLDPSTFTGRVFIYEADNSAFLGGFVLISGKRAGTIRPADVKNPALKVSLVQAPSTNCEWIEDNYVNAEGVYTVFAEKICTVDLVDFSQESPPGLPPIDQNPPEYSGGGGGGASSSAPAVSILPGENNPKIDPKAYMNCFASLPDIGSKMTVTVFVLEPAPGLPFNVGTNSVGHTAIGLTKTYNGQSITQVIGFYPDAEGKAKMHAPGKVLDNSGLSFSVSISYPIIASEFNKIVGFIADPPLTYDLLNYNCTNFAYNACLAGGIKLPEPVGNMGLAQSGMMPSALGNSVRNVGSTGNTNLNGGSVGQTHGPCTK